MRPLAHWIAAMLLVVTSLGTAAQSEEKFRASGANAGLPSRYRVHLALQPGDELETVIRQLTATYGGRLEPYAEVGFEGFVIVVSETRARLLSSDPRVAVVEEMPPAAVLPPPPPERERQEPAVTVDAVRPRMEIGTEAIPGFGTYAYDGSGNITSIGDASGTDSYFYDRLGRLQSTILRGEPCRVLTAGQPCRTQEFTYDRYGNILTILTATPLPGAPITQIMAVDPLTNQLDKSDVPNANVLGTYDGRGNLVSYTSGQFVYDGLDLVTEATVGGTRRMHVYSASDERVVTVGKVDSTVTGSDWTIRDAGGRVLRRLTQDGQGTFKWAEDYVYRDGQLLAAAVPTAEKVRHFHLDHLGTPRLITGNGGAEIAQHQYFPFGVESSSSTNDGERAKFTGHERDAATLDYMHARYYDPYIGRFLSVDPGEDWDTHDPQSWNGYSYVRNNPINTTDPSGKCGESADFIGPVVPCDMEIEVVAETPSYFVHVIWYAEETTGELSPFGPLPLIPSDPWQLWAMYLAKQNPVEPAIYNGFPPIVGPFSIRNFQGYPPNAPRPAGPFQVLEGQEYVAARNAANNANRALHRADPSLTGKEIHEIHPVKFGGSPTDAANKIPLTPTEHRALTSWWSRFLNKLRNP